MKTISLSALLILSLSCASIKPQDFQPTPKNTTLLPPLEPRVDLYSFESAYTAGHVQSTSVGYGTALAGTPGLLGVSVSNGTVTKDPRVQDAITYFDRDIKNNITNPYGQRNGYALAKIVNGKSGPSSFAASMLYAVLAGGTLFVGNMLGLPLSDNKTELEVEVEIYDVSNNLVAKYNSSCSDRQWVAMYYGYAPLDAGRVAGINAFKCALNKIKQEIDKDSVRVAGELQKNRGIASEIMK